MRSTYLFETARAFARRPGYPAAARQTLDFARQRNSCAIGCALALLALLALAGCGSVQVTSGSGGIPGTLSGAGTQLPVVNCAPTTAAQVGVLYDYTPNVSDPLGNALTFNISNMPAWANFNTATGELRGTPAADDIGSTAEIEIGVSNGAGLATIGPFRITVTNPQTSPPAAGPPPVIGGAPTASVVVGQAYSFVPTASDPSGGALTFSIVNRPSWTIFNTATGALFGTPTAANIGAFANIMISVSNGSSTVSLPAFTVTVCGLPTDGSPSIAGTPATSVTAGSTYSFTPTASDPNGLTLTFSIQNPPAWSNFNTATGELSGTPTSADVGSFANITISASNGTTTASLPAFTITVAATGLGGPPSISGTPAKLATAGVAYNFTPTATDPGGQPLTFSIQNQPSWASFKKDTGELSGTPAAANVGVFANVVITVSDGVATASLPSFTIAVSAPPADGPPTISGNPTATVTAGSAYSFTPTASDPQGHALTFSVRNQPSWATFRTATGQLSGTPSSQNVGTFADIVVSVSNGTSSASLPAFSITVTAQPADGPPTIGGTPATAVNVGSAYSFTPTASDPQGHALTFSIQNQPSWANFDTNTGQLSGTPAAANVGSFANIVIRVTNDTSSAALPAFTINVTATSTGSATITWAVPTQNTNGTPLVNLAGYRIYYGTSTNNLSQSVQITNPSLTTYMVADLAPGTWYFAMVDYTSAGDVSDYSNIGSKTVQ
jgi:hypothetical protein